MADVRTAHSSILTVAEPRPMIKTEQITTNTKAIKKVFWLEREIWLVAGLILIGLLAHGLNMFHYPSFTFLDDEGIYTGQAWAILREGKISYYTYFYDHAPAGWMLLAGWMWITGGPHTFGGAIDSGRVLMLLLHLAMIPMLYQIARKLGGSVTIAALTTLLFSLSPLAIFYQRMVLLDNIMLFWLLLSVNLLLDGWGRLSRVVLSGVCFGLAVVSKETAIFMLPAMLYIVYQQRWKHQGRFAFIGWIALALTVISWYALYAALKGELLPNGDLASLVGGTGGDSIQAASGVSLINAIVWQMSRGGGGLFNLNNDFWQFVRSDWLPRDPILFAGGSVAVFGNIIRGLRDRRLMAAGLLGLMPLFYLGHGGIVMNYYILFAIPFLALNLALALQPLLQRVPNVFKANYAVSAGFAVVLVVGYCGIGSIQPLFAEYPDEAGREAIQWLKANVPANSYIIGRDDLWTDMHEPGLGGPAFPNFHTHWKADLDPAIRNKVFGDNWQNVDYLIVSPGFTETLQATSDSLTLQALQHAHLVKSWQSDIGTIAYEPHQIEELYKVDKVGTTEQTNLDASNGYMWQHFDQNGAMVSNGSVSAEAETQAMLRAVWTNDRAHFNQTWQWTQQHLLNSNGLLTSSWKIDGTTSNTSDSNADSDAALALLLAAKQWNDPALQTASQNVIKAIWQHEVVTIQNTPYIAAGDWAAQAQTVVFSPGYFAPYAYKMFQQVDPTHNWNGVVSSGYQVLFNSIKVLPGGTKTAGLPPDWIGLNRTNGQLVVLPTTNGATCASTCYSSEAPLTYWRVALDLNWSNDGRASQFLQQAGFLKDEVNRLLADGITYKHMVSAIYQHDGTVVRDEPSMVGTAGAIAALLKLDPASANILYSGQILAGVTRTNQGLFWGDPNDLNTQEWGWLATALYSNQLTNK